MNPARTFTAVVQWDAETGLSVGRILGWPGAHSQDATVDELLVQVGWISGSVRVLKPREVERLLERHGLALALGAGRQNTNDLRQDFREVFREATVCAADWRSSHHQL